MIVWVLVLLLLCLVLLGAIVRLEWDHHKTERRNDRADHAKCMAMVSSVLSRRFTASLVRDLAVKFDSVENQLELARIRNGYTGDSESVVALWLREQAALIEASHE